MLATDHGWLPITDAQHPEVPFVRTYAPNPRLTCLWQLQSYGHMSHSSMLPGEFSLCARALCLWTWGAVVSIPYCGVLRRLTWQHSGGQECPASQPCGVGLWWCRTPGLPSAARLPPHHGFLLGKGLLQLWWCTPLPVDMSQNLQILCIRSACTRLGQSARQFQF